LFERHSKVTIKKWLRELRYFYLIRAWGGHANDGDEFQVAFKFSDEQDLISKLQQLGLKVHDCFEQPGRSILFGYEAFVWVNENSVFITVSGTKDNNPYEVSEDDFKACRELEKCFDNLSWLSLRDNSLEHSVCCISRSKYPELFDEETT
jgi:hypothetical protein